MASTDPNTDRKKTRSGGGISLQTLLIASVASAAASFTASRIWGPGTLVSAAATPVVVALVSEFLRRPVETVASTARKVPVARPVPVVRRRTRAAPQDPSSGRDTADTSPPVDSGTVKPAQAGTWRPRWRVAIATGLIAFGIVVAFYTLPDLVAGQSITGNGDQTTLFGGSASPKKKTNTTTTTVTTTTHATTVTKTAPTTSTTKSTTSSTSTSKTTTTPTTTSSSTATSTTTPPTTATTPPALSTSATATTTAH